METSTVFALVYVKQGIGLDVSDETCIGSQNIFDDNLEEESDPSIEIVFDLGLGAGLR